MKKIALFHMEKTLTDTNWSYFGDIIGAGMFIEKSNNQYKKLIFALDNNENSDQLIDNIIKVLKYIKDTHNVYTYGGLQYFYSLLLKNNNNDLIEELALNHYDFLYSIYKELGYCISFNSIISGMKLNPTGLISNEMIDLYFASGKTENIKNHIDSKLFNLLHIYYHYSKHNSISWITKNNNLNTINFELKNVENTLNTSWQIDTSWLGENKKQESDFFAWFKELN